MVNKMFKLLSRFLIILTILFAALSSNILLAEDDEEETPEEMILMYYEIDPNILTFYQGTGKKIGYVVVQVNVAVRGQENYDLVELHLPLIQDNLIVFFNEQDKSKIQPFSERENLRIAAKESVATVLKEELGKDIVENLLFTNYIFQ